MAWHPAPAHAGASGEYAPQIQPQLLWSDAEGVAHASVQGEGGEQGSPWMAAL